MQGFHVQWTSTFIKLLALHQVASRARTEVCKSVADCPDNFNIYDEDSSVMAPQNLSTNCHLLDGSWLVSLNWTFPLSTITNLQHNLQHVRVQYVCS
jgi:hypothetical protein